MSAWIEQLKEPGKLYGFSQFVIRANRQHHTGALPDALNDAERLLIRQVYEEDYLFFPNSYYYLAYTDQSRKALLGSVKVTRWNGTDLLPVQKLFNIDMDALCTAFNCNEVWHVGRLAIDRSSPKASGSLLKKLMMYAIMPVVSNAPALLIAECDEKLLSVLRLLHIDIHILGAPVEYLYSRTWPVCMTTAGLAVFAERNLHLYPREETVTRIAS